MANIKVVIITIGDELLIGQTIDTNSAWIAQRLNELGIEVSRRVAVADDAWDIRNALDEEIPRADAILITGGLGPTSDDITKPLLTEYFGGKLVLDERVLVHVKEMFSKRNRPFLDRNLKQAEVPDNCRVLFNRVGTAPGMLFTKGNKVIISMPGVPFEMMAIMEDEVIPFLHRHFPSDALIHRTILTAGEGESFIAERIADIEATMPEHIRLAYLPATGMVKLRLTGRSDAKETLAKELDTKQQEIADRLNDIVVSLYDIPFEQILGQSLLTKKLTLGLAESCTGGYIGHTITQVAGASQYFKGGIICYNEDIKEDLLGVSSHTLETMGVVSEQTAMEMAKGALNVLKCDCAFGITGLLGPATDADKEPVGTVWMAVADKNRTITKEFRLHYDRPRNKDMALQMSMLMIWKFVNGKI